MNIPFNKPYITGSELSYIQQAIENLHLSGNGHFTKKCQHWLEQTTGTSRALLVHSGTAGLELASILLNIKSGDEVIMPSFTFVSTANAFVLRGAIPVFVDIRPDTLNIDENLIESAITKKTRAIVPVHYAGVSCEMDPILGIAKKYGLFIIEDAAHSLLSEYKGKPVGGLGHVSALSFHETKNIIAGESGAILVNTPDLVERAEIIVEKGTNRTQYFQGLVDKYTWKDVGSSFFPSEIEAAFLWAQIEHASYIVNRRLTIWHEYHNLLEPLEQKGYLTRPTIPAHCQSNGHLYHILLNARYPRADVLSYLKKSGIDAIFHYVPLHQSPAGSKYARVYGTLYNTEQLSARLVRLPLWADMSIEVLKTIVTQLYAYFGEPAMPISGRLADHQLSL